MSSGITRLRDEERPRSDRRAGLRLVEGGTVDTKVLADSLGGFTCRPNRNDCQDMSALSHDWPNPVKRKPHPVQTG